MLEQWWNASWPLNRGPVGWDLPTLPLHSWYSDWHLWSRFCSAGRKNGTWFSSTVNAGPGTRLSSNVRSPSQEVNEKIAAGKSEWKYHHNTICVDQIIIWMLCICKSYWIADCTIRDVIWILICVHVFHVVPQKISHIVMSEGFITVEYHWVFHCIKKFTVGLMCMCKRNIFIVFI